MVLRSMLFKDKDCKVNQIFFTQMIVDYYKNSISAVSFKKFNIINEMYICTQTHSHRSLFIYLCTYLPTLRYWKLDAVKEIQKYIKYRSQKAYWKAVAEPGMQSTHPNSSFHIKPSFLLPCSDSTAEMQQLFLVQLLLTGLWHFYWNLIN